MLIMDRKGEMLDLNFVGFSSGLFLSHTQRKKMEPKKTKTNKQNRKTNKQKNVNAGIVPLKVMVRGGKNESAFILRYFGTPIFDSVMSYSSHNLSCSMALSVQRSTEVVNAFRFPKNFQFFSCVFTGELM